MRSTRVNYTSQSTAASVVLEICATRGVWFLIHTHSTVSMYYIIESERTETSLVTICPLLPSPCEHGQSFETFCVDNSFWFDIHILPSNLKKVGPVSKIVHMLHHIAFVFFFKGPVLPSTPTVPPALTVPTASTTVHLRM